MSIPSISRVLELIALCMKDDRLFAEVIFHQDNQVVSFMSERGVRLSGHGPQSVLRMCVCLCVFSD